MAKVFDEKLNHKQGLWHLAGNAPSVRYDKSGADHPVQRTTFPCLQAVASATTLPASHNALGAFLFFDVDSYLTLEAVRANRDQLMAFTEAHRPAAVVSFIVTYCLVTGLSLPGAAILTLVVTYLVSHR